VDPAVSGLPSRRFREAQLLIFAALGLLFAMVLVEMQGMLALARAAEREALRGVESAAALVGAELSAEHGLWFQAPPREGLGVALLVDGKVARRAGTAGPLEPAWWPWRDEAAWRAAGGAAAGPLVDAGRQVVVAYQSLGDGRAVRVVQRVSSASLLGQWRLLGAGLAILVAGAGGVLAMLLVGRVLAPYRDLMAEAVRVTERPSGEAEDRFLIDTFRRAVERLEASEQQQRQRADELEVLAAVLTRESGAGVVITDAAGAVRAGNPRAEELTGAALTAGQPLPAVLRGAAGRIRLGERVVGVRRTPLLSSVGTTQGEVLFLADTTQLDALERALAEREQMATLGELSAGTAHELRNALATMKGYLRLLPGAAVAEQGRYLGAIDDEMAAVGTVLDRFLRFAQPHELKRESLELLALAGETAAKLRPSFPGVALEVRGEPVEIAGDALALGVVLENLLRNAAEAAMQGGGRVDVRVEPRAPLALVVVEDDGPGVSPEVGERLFAPFVSTKPSGGLGLALARRFARLHGGDVEHEPRAGGGARFVLRLPRGGVA
jgi:signal transduction histidine kinase